MNPNLLFAGLEFGVYFTVDGGIALGAARRQAFPPHKRAIWRFSGARTISSSEHSVVARSSSTTTQRFVTSRR